MKKLTFTLTVLLSTILQTFGQDSTKIVNQFEMQINEFTRQLIQKDNEQKEALKTIASTTDQNVKTLNDNILRLEKRIQSLEDNKLHIRYEAGKLITTKMIDGLNIISFIQIIANLQDEVRKTTAVWNYEPIKNTWDRVYDYTTAAGAILAAGAVFLDNSNQQKTGIAIGLNIIAIPRIIGLVSNKNKKQEDKMKNFAMQLDTAFQFMSLSRKAFDDLAVLNYKLNGYIKSNEEFKLRLSVFQTKFLSEKDDEKKIENLYHLSELINEYEQSLKQIPTYLTEIKSFQEQYIFAYPQFKDKFLSLIQNTNIADEYYSKNILPILKVDKSKIIKPI